MPRAAARPLVTTIALFTFACLAGGCGGASGADGPGGYQASAPTASQEIGKSTESTFDRLMGRYEQPSGVSRDTSILDSVDASYGGVPGASMLDDTSLQSMAYEDDVMSSTAVSNLSFDDPSITSLTLNDGLSLDDDPLSAASSRLSFDSAMADAEETYGGMGGDIGGGMDELDTLDDMAFEADPEFDTGMGQDMGFEDPMW